MNLLNTTLVTYVLKASLRDKLVISLTLLYVIGICLSIFIGSSAIIEDDRTVITFIAASSRFIVVFALLLFTVFYVRRSFDTHDVEYLLSRPVSRPGYVISHLAGLTLLNLVLTLFIACGLYIAGSQAMSFNGFLLWAISLFFELTIVIHAAFFFSMALPSAISATLATMAAYVLARMSGQVLGIIDTGAYGVVLSFFSKIMEAASVIVPRFDLFTQSSWLLYGPTTVGLAYIVATGVAFSLLILCATIFDLLNRQF